MNSFKVKRIRGVMVKIAVKPAKPRAKKTAAKKTAAKAPKKAAKSRAKKASHAERAEHHAPAKKAAAKKPAKPRAKKTAAKKTAAKAPKKPAKPRAKKVAHVEHQEHAKKPAKPRAKKKTASSGSTRSKAKAPSTEHCEKYPRRFTAGGAMRALQDLGGSANLRDLRHQLERNQLADTIDDLQNRSLVRVTPAKDANPDHAVLTALV